MAVDMTSAEVFTFVWVLKSDALMRMTVCINPNPLKRSERKSTRETGIRNGSLNRLAIKGAPKKSMI